MTAPVRYLVVLLLATVFGVLGVAQQTRVFHLGYRVERLHDEQTILGDANRRLLCEIGALSHPARIAGEAARLDVGLWDPVALTRSFAREASGAHLGVERNRSR